MNTHSSQSDWDDKVSLIWCWPSEKTHGELKILVCGCWYRVNFLLSILSLIIMFNNYVASDTFFLTDYVVYIICNFQSVRETIVGLEIIWMVFVFSICALSCDESGPCLICSPCLLSNRTFYGIKIKLDRQWLLVSSHGYSLRKGPTSHHPHGNSQPPATLVLGDLRLPSGLCGLAYTQYKGMHSSEHPYT